MTATGTTPTDDDRSATSGLFTSHRYTNTWIAVGATASIVIAVFTAILVYQSIRQALQQIESTALTFVATVLLTIALIVAALSTVSIVRGLVARKPPPPPPVVPWYVSDAMILADRVKEIWSSQANQLWSFSFVARSVQSALINPAPGPGGLTEAERIQATQATSYFLSWLLSGQSLRNSIDIAHYFLDNFGSSSIDWFNRALEMIIIQTQDGVRVANAVAQSARAAGVLRVAPYVKDQWSVFRDRANRLSEDITSFVRKYRQTTEPGEIPFIETIQELS